MTKFALPNKGISPNRRLAIIGEERDRLLAEIRELESREYLVATNQGTYSAQEACRKVGTGDPAFADRNVYETVGGKKRTTGPDHDDAPGRMREFPGNRQDMGADRKRLAELRKELAPISKAYEECEEELTPRRDWNY